MFPRSRSPWFSWLVSAAFFLSGAACLISEVTWNRMLIVVVGNSLSSAALIVMLFMGGLGLGSYLAGRILGPRPRSLVPYLSLEAFVGVYVLLSPRLFALLDHVFVDLAGGGAHQDALGAIRLLVTAAALLIPAAAMGATFPAIVAGATTGDTARRTARTGYLYSLNTVGAALGTFVAGYHLLLEFGVHFTIAIAAALYAAAALLAAVAQLARGNRPAAAPDSAEAAAAGEPSVTGTGGGRRFLKVATALVGFVSLAYEILLTRFGILYLGNSVSVFPLVLTAFLLGTGFSAVAGTWLHGALRRAGRDADRLFGLAAAVAGIAVMAIPYLLLSVGVGDFARFADATPRNPLPILGLMIVPTIALGALLPIAIRMLGEREGSGAPRGAATLYALNTVGGLVGAGVANHYLVPWIGTQHTLLLLSTLCVGVAAWNLAGTGRALRAAAAAAAVWVVALVLLPPSLSGMYADKLAASTLAERTDVKLTREGRAATVTVLDQFDSRRGTYRDMYLNGVEEASTRYWHAQLFKLLGILPVMVHGGDRPLDTLVIAFGAGITAGSVLASDRVASLDVVDLNPDIEGINDLFTDVNDDVYHKPRFHFRNDDGRGHLVTTGKRYDAIIGDSTHPRAYDSWILYTREFYETVRKRLAPDGVFAQWVPVLGSMRGELFRIHLNTFRSVFPNATFWYVYGSDQAFLLSTPEPLELDVDRLQAQLDRLPAWFRADEYQLDTVAHLAGFFWMDGPAMDALIGPETRVNTDDVHFFDKQSALRPLPPPLQLPMFQAAVTPYLVGADGPLLAAVRREQATAGALAEYGFYGQREDLDRAFCGAPDNGDARWWMSLATGGDLPAREKACRDEEIESYRALLSQHPDNVDALNALADLLGAAGRLDEALALAQRAVSARPDDGKILDTYGWILHLRGDHAAAVAALERADAALPGHPIVTKHLAAARAAASAAGATDGG